MTVRAHYELVCDGGFTERCVRSTECEGYLVLDPNHGSGIRNRDVRGQARAAGWSWVVDVRGDVQLCPACMEANRAHHEVTKGA